MGLSISYHKQFAKDAKRIAKKYRSFPTDLAAFVAEIKANPDLGTDLGGGVRKARMALASKGKGKSGGARIITYKKQTVQDGSCLISFLTIYDKNEIENVSDSFIQYLVNTIDETDR